MAMTERDYPEEFVSGDNDFETPQVTKLETPAYVRHGGVMGCKDCKRMGYICDAHARPSMEDY